MADNQLRQLYSIIMQYQLHFRSKEWNQLKEDIEDGTLTEKHADFYLAEAHEAARWVVENGNWLWQPPEEAELFADGPPDIFLGNLVEGLKYRCGIRLTGRPRNCLVVGSAGYGKTVLLRNICKKINDYNLRNPNKKIIVIIIDSKGDFWDLPLLFGPDWQLFSRYHGLRFGLNGPAGVPPQLWISQISTALAARLGMMLSRTVFTQLIDRLLIAMNPNPGNSPLVYPPLALVLEAVKNKAIAECVSQKESYDQTMIQSIEGFLQDSENLFDCCNGLDINSAIADGRHVILDIVNTEASVRNFIADLAIDQVMIPRLQHGIKVDNTERIFMLDEVDLLIDKKFEAAFKDGMSPLSKLSRLGREFGLGSIISISAIQHAVDYILSSCVYTFAFRLLDSESVRAAIQTLLINPRCGRLLSSLKPGDCIYRQTDGWSNAMLCKMDYIAPGRNLTNIRYSKHPVIPAKTLDQMPEVVHALNRLIDEHRSTRKRQEVWFQSDIEKQALELLTLAIERPFVPVARLFEKMGKVRFTTQEKIRKILEKKKLAEFEEIHIGSPNVLLIDPCDDGRKQLGKPIPGRKGRGGIAHRHFAHWIKQYFERQGIAASIEATVPGTNHPCDVAIEVKHHWKIFEICVSSHENLLSHCKECFDVSTAVESITVIAATKAALNIIKDTMKGSPYFGRMSFETIQQYMPKEKK
jgi:hypothetical protein